jgi:hypothetical protein
MNEEKAAYNGILRYPNRTLVIGPVHIWTHLNDRLRKIKTSKHYFQLAKKLPVNR